MESASANTQALKSKNKSVYLSIIEGASMTGYTFKRVGYPTDNGLVNEIDAKRRKLRQSEKEEQQQRERKHKYKIKTGIWVWHAPLNPLSARKKKKRTTTE